MERISRRLKASHNEALTFRLGFLVFFQIFIQMCKKKKKKTRATKNEIAARRRQKGGEKCEVNENSPERGGWAREETRPMATSCSSSSSNGR